MNLLLYNINRDIELDYPDVIDEFSKTNYYN